MDIDLLSKMLKELILDKDEVSLPGIGSFVAELVPSTFSDKGYTINPPYRRLYFRQKKNDGDTSLADLYAESNNIDSGILASLLVLRVLANMKKKGITFSQAIKGIAKYENSGEINFKVEDKAGAMEAVRNYFSSKETPLEFMDFDGYRVEFKDWWFNIRPSNTEPYLRFLCEAKSKALLEEKIAATENIIRTQFGGTR